MSESLFGVVLIVLGIIYGLKDYVTNLINEELEKNDSSFKLKSEYVSYLLFIVLAVTLVFGMMLGTKTKTTFDNVSSGFEKVRAKDDGRPHPLFDIDTYW